MGKLELYRNEALYLVERNGTYYVHGSIDGKRIRRSCETRNLNAAKTFLDSLGREYAGWRVDNDVVALSWKDVAKAVHNRHRTSASVRGMVYDLRPSDVYDLMKSTGFRCAVSGVPFSTRANSPRDPWAPSIDRIENRHGYVLDNVRVVSLAANIAMNNWGLDVLLRLARGVVKSSEVVHAEQKVTPNMTDDTAVPCQVIELANRI